MQVLNEQEVAQNVQKIAQDVREAALQAGRDPSEVQVMAVTKTVDPVLVNAAIGAGITLLGENKAQELCAKYDSYHKDGVQIHFIGHLQTNKVRQIVDKVSMVESVDSIKLAREIDRHSAGDTVELTVCRYYSENGTPLAQYEVFTAEVELKIID